MNTGTIQKWIMIMVLASVLFTVVATLIPEMETSGDLINSTGISFGSFFATGGIVFTLIAVGLLILVIKSFMPGGRK